MIVGFTSYLGAASGSPGFGILHCPKARTSVNFSRLLPEHAYGRWGKVRTRWTASNSNYQLGNVIYTILVSLIYSHSLPEAHLVYSHPSFDLECSVPLLDYILGWQPVVFPICEMGPRPSSWDACRKGFQDSDSINMRRSTYFSTRTMKQLFPCCVFGISRQE